MSLEQFKATRKGSKIGDILGAPSALRGMVDKSLHDRPAVEAVGAEIAEAVGDLDETERKYVGRWVKDILERQGLVPDRKGRVAGGNLFTKGTIYRRVRGPAQREPALDRLEKARRLLAGLPHRVMSADELLADRRQAFGRGE